MAAQAQTRRIRLDRLPNIRPEGALLSQNFDVVQEGGDWLLKTGNGIIPIGKQDDPGIRNDEWGDVLALCEHNPHNDFTKDLVFVAMATGIYAYYPNSLTGVKWDKLTESSYYSTYYVQAMKKDTFGHITALRGDGQQFSTNYLDRIILGRPTSGNTLKIVDTAKNWADYGVAVGDLVVNLTGRGKSVVTSISTTTNTNDTLNFLALSNSASFDVSATDQYYAVFTRDLQDTQLTIDGDTRSRSPYQKQVDIIGNLTIFPTERNYLGMYSAADASDIDLQWKLMPSETSFSCMGINRGYMLVGVRSVGDDRGKLLLWDTFSDGFNNIIELDSIPTSIKAYSSGWLVSANGIEYYTDGYSMTEMFDWGADKRRAGQTILTPGCEGKLVKDGYVYMAVQGESSYREVGGILKYNIKIGEWSVSPFTYYPTAPAANFVHAPGAMTDSAAAGTVSWSTPNNALLEDGAFTTATFAASATIPQDTIVQLMYGGSGQGENKAAVANLGTSLAFKQYGGDGDNWGLPLTAAIVESDAFGVQLQFSSGAALSHYLRANEFAFDIPADSYITGVKVRVKEKYAASGGNEIVSVDYVEMTVYYLTRKTISEELSQSTTLISACLLRSSAFEQFFIGGVNSLLYELSASLLGSNNAVYISPVIIFPREVIIERVHVHLAPIDSPLQVMYGVANMEVKIADASQKIFRSGSLATVVDLDTVTINGTVNTGLNIGEAGDEVFLSGNNAIAGGQRVHIASVANEGLSNETWTFDREFRDLPATSLDIQSRPFKLMGAVEISPDRATHKTNKLFFDNNTGLDSTDRIHLEIVINADDEVTQAIAISAIEIEYIVTTRS